MIEHLAQFRGRTPGEEEAWLRTSARTQLVRHWKRSALRREVIGKLAVRDADAVSDDVDAAERAASAGETSVLWEAVGRLPSGQQRALALRVVDELEYVAVAQALSIDERAARARVSRALRALGRDRELASSPTQISEEHDDAGRRAGTLPKPPSDPLACARRQNITGSSPEAACRDAAE